MAGRSLVATLVAASALSALAPAAGSSAPSVTAWRVNELVQGPSFAEPGVAAGPRTGLLVSACDANSGVAASFWRSPDAGRTWSRPFTVGGSAIGCGDADTAIGPDGYEYALVLGTGVTVYRSKDGRSWSGPATFPAVARAGQPDRPWFVTDPRRPNVVRLFTSEVGGNVVEWTSTDHAASFTGPALVTRGANSEAALTIGSRPLVDPTDPARIMLFYETADLAGTLASVDGQELTAFPFGQLWEASSTDGGGTWTNRKVVTVASTFHGRSGTLGHLLPATAVDAQGTVYVVLSVQLATDPATHLYLLHAKAGGPWSPPVRIDRGVGSNVYPALAVAHPGQLYLSWYASPTPSFAASSARWSEEVATVTGALSAQPAVHVVRLGPDPVHVGAIEQAGAVGHDLGEDWSLRDFQSVTADACGHPHVMWADDASAPGRVFTATTGRPCRVRVAKKVRRAR